MDNDYIELTVPSKPDQLRLKSGVDITTGHGADSFYYKNEITDPWASRCLTNFIDAVVNHEEVEYPLPSDVALARLDEELLPRTFVDGQEHKLILPLTTQSAEKIILEDDELNKQFCSFFKWSTGDDSLKLAGWARFHRENKRLAHSHDIHVPIHMVQEFWNRLPQQQKNDFVRLLQIPDSYVSYAFDVFVRSVQYYRILGATNPAFFHPMRDKSYSELSLLSRYQRQWSWGKYLTGFCMNAGYFNDRRSLFAKLENIRELTLKYHATWYELSPQPKSNRIDLLSTIASQCNLPAKLKDEAVQQIRTFLFAATFVNYSEPIINLSLFGGRIAAQVWKGNVSTTLAATIPALKGLMVWPDLTDTDE